MRLQKNMHDGAAARHNSRLTRHAQESGLGVEYYACPSWSPRLIHMNFIHVDISERAPSDVVTRYQEVVTVFGADILVCV